jgi:membrane-bound lytic murein transglycosylase D
VFNFRLNLPIGEGPMTRFICTFKFVLAVAALCIAMTVATLASSAELSASGALPRPPELADDIRFWVRIYSEVTTGSGLIHDSRNLRVVYDVVKIPSGLSRRAKERWTDSVKSRYRKILTTLSKGKRTGLTDEETRVLSLWPSGVSNSELRAAKSRLRFQLGQSDRFRAGIVRSGRWKAYIEEVFAAHGLPRELVALPQVESSFTPWAYSRVGASGLWQFTRSTGRRFLRIDHVIDERLDPFRATVAAARLLVQNRTVTGSWPLAITAYNHGASGMRRAVRKLGTHDIVTINRKYKSRTFGFASRNFYVELLAAAEVSENYLNYFGPLELDTPIDYVAFELPFYTTPAALCSALGIERTSFERANPSLRPSVWQGAKYIPRKFPLRVPKSQLARPVALAIDSIPDNQRHAAQTKDLDYRVRRGDTLSTIARRFRVSVSQLVAINGLRSRHKIRVGQKLKLPGNDLTLQAAKTARSSRPVARAPVPASGQYTVRRGDTVSRIAKRFGLEESEILDANQLRNRNRIYPGQMLNLRKPETGQLFASAGRAASEPHPDAVATLSNPPDRPDEGLEPMQGGVLVATADETVQSDFAGLLADPSEYGVANDDTIEVQATETLGHYAEWLNIRASRLRRINDLTYGHPIAIGQRIAIDLSSIDRQQFEARRQDYHRAMQEEFFERYEIEGTRTHIARRGDSVWKLAEKDYRIPLWLLRQYNPDLDFASLQKGTRIMVPELKQRESWQAPKSAT